MDTAVWGTNGDYIKTIISEDNVQVLKVTDVVYIESHGHYLSIYMTKGTITIRSKVNEFLEGIEEMFLRVHQSFAVNMDYVRKLDQTEIELKDGRKIPVSRRKHKDAKEKLIHYLQG